MKIRIPANNNIRQLAYIAVLIFLPCVCERSAGEQPNILVILADDMGYADAGCLGSQVLETPNIDGLAASGVRCTQAYVASAVCSPSRAGLLTGRDPRRFGYQANLNQTPSKYAGRAELLGLPQGEKTLADHLAQAGYSTGLVGKWHLGIGNGFHPNERGFDYFCGMLQGSHGYFPTEGQHTIQRNGKSVKGFSSPYLTDFFTDECIAFMQRQQTEGKPWFLLASYNAPHTPMQATENDLARFEHIKDAKRRTYAAMMWALDRGIGKMRQHLEATGQWENTLCVFLSDNGGATTNRSWNGPLRGVKGCLREGGIRVPMIWTWPAQIPSGRSTASVFSSLDLLPTFMAAAGAEPLPLAAPSSHLDSRNRTRMIKLAGPYDGMNVLPLLANPKQSIARRLYWRLQGQTAILDGTDKAVRLNHRRPELFRVSTDIGENHELSSIETARLDELLQELSEWEFRLPTHPIWGSSPYWDGQSAKHYDEWEHRQEPGTSEEVPR